MIFTTSRRITVSASANQGPGEWDLIPLWELLAENPNTLHPQPRADLADVRGGVKQDVFIFPQE